jgi:hypothetical protein
MNSRPKEVLGVLVVIIGLLLMPAALAFSRTLWLLAFCFLVGGLWLFYTERNIRKQDKLDRLSGRGSYQGSGRPNEISDYMGWSRAGRSETMDSAADSDGADGE